MSCLLAMEAQSLLYAAFFLFQGELSYADDINIHHIRVSDFQGVRGEGLIQMLNGTLIPS